MAHFKTLTLVRPALADERIADTGFEIGWDFGHYGIVPPSEHLHPLSSVRQGWEASRLNFGQRTLLVNRFSRSWLQLRLGAWRSGRVFERSEVSPTYLRQIDVACCPITREILTHGSGIWSDASVDRVCDDGAYAAGNLAVMSQRANQAKADKTVDQLLALARQVAAAPQQSNEFRSNLTAEQWARLAVLASFATPMTHAKAACIPLLVLPPNRLRVLNPVQSLQLILSRQFTQAGHGRRCSSIAGQMPSKETRRAFDNFMSLLLERRTAAKRPAGLLELRHSIEDLWSDPMINSRWQRLALGLTSEACERIVCAAVEGGLAGPSMRWISPAVATENWSLASRGFVSGATNTERSSNAGGNILLMPARKTH